MSTWKPTALTIQTFFGKVMSLLFNILSRFLTAFLPMSKCLLISWLQSKSTVILKPKKVKSITVSTFFPIYLPWSDGTRCHVLSFFGCWDLSQHLHSPLSSSSRGCLIPLHFLPLEWYHLHIGVCWYLSQYLDSSLWFTQSRFLHDVFCIEFK